MSHRFVVALAVALQVLILVAIAGIRQYTLATGTIVLLETAPVDPRDLFRGDYVVLQYRISELDPGALGATESFRPGQPVYIGLEQRDRYWEAVSIGTSRPAGLHLRGRITAIYHTGVDRVQVEYGIESYFVPEGKGRTAEISREPLSVEVAVGRDGRAVIRRLFLGDRSFP